MEFSQPSFASRFYYFLNVRWANGGKNFMGKNVIAFWSN